MQSCDRNFHFRSLLGEPANLADASGEVFPGDPDYSLKTMLVMCVKDTNGECVAVVQAVNKCFDGKFTGGDEEMLSSFCAQIGSLIKRRALQATYTNVLKESGDNALRELLTLYTEGGQPDDPNSKPVTSAYDNAHNQLEGTEHKVHTHRRKHIIYNTGAVLTGFDCSCSRRSANRRFGSF